MSSNQTKMKTIIDQYENQIAEIIMQKELKALYDNDYVYNNRNILDVLKISKLQNPKMPNFNKFKNCWDIINCNVDFRLHVALLYIYLPYINNPIKEFFKDEDFYSALYFQNIYDKRFSCYASICFEKLYNYLDRVGDLLAYNDLKFQRYSESKIYFNTAIDNFKKDKLFYGQKYFDKIVKYRDEEYKIINSNRSQIVHYYHFETQYRFDFTMNSTNKEKINELWAFKSSLPEFFKERLYHSNELFYNVLNFLEKELS